MVELTLKEIQEISLSIMIKIDEICKQQGFRYYLYGGSLLGAVRHKGFIPWDDDIDIVMPREDYKRLLDHMREHELELKPLKLFTRYDDKRYPYMISRVSNDDYYLDIENEKPYGMGIFVDVYPWDGIGATEDEVAVRKGRSSRLSSLCYLATRNKCKKENTRSKKKLIIKPFAFIFAKMVGKEYFMQKLEEMSLLYGYDTSDHVGCLVWGCDGVKGIFPREWMGNEEVRLEFEGHMFRVPKEYDKALTRLYKDYMDLPPIEDRIPHHRYKAYRKY